MHESGEPPSLLHAACGLLGSLPLLLFTALLYEHGRTFASIDLTHTFLVHIPSELRSPFTIPLPNRLPSPLANLSLPIPIGLMVVFTMFS